MRPLALPVSASPLIAARGACLPSVSGMAPGLPRFPESKKAAPQAACPLLPSYHSFPHVKFPARLERNRLSVQGRDCRWCASWVRRNPVSSRLPERPPPGPAIEPETHACRTPPPSVPYRERWYEYSLYQRSSIGTYADCRRQTPLPLAGEAGWGAASAPAGAAGEARQRRPSRREALPQPLPPSGRGARRNAPNMSPASRTLVLLRICQCRGPMGTK